MSCKILLQAQELKNRSRRNRCQLCDSTLSLTNYNTCAWHDSATIVLYCELITSEFPVNTRLLLCPKNKSY
ncbi:unnamed protein product [Pocillopora meandrina]|uniref:Uncharacterized protein n=1 Tax=Pocillopora meandrina TaxID=46732 RepID=A0AAU9XE15_9CNID|nr:unnamed protein product [Pocillopora meandrina]